MYIFLLFGKKIGFLIKSKESNIVLSPIDFDYMDTNNWTVNGKLSL